MKVNYFFTLALSILCIVTQAQNYHFETFTDDYAELTSPTSVNNGQVWDDPEYKIPIGFEFQYFDTVASYIYISGVGLGGFLSFDTLGAGAIPLLIAYGTDIIDRGEADGESLSPISYTLDGTAGSRVFKLEWKNVGFYSELYDDGTSVDFTNFQLWLYEGSNTIDIRLGANSITQPNVCFEGESGSFVGIFPSYNTTTDELEEGIMLAGDPSSPDTVLVDSEYEVVYLDSIIPEGTVYKFYNTLTHTTDLAQASKQVSLYPNPAGDKVMISVDNTQMEINRICITDSQGKVLHTLAYQSNVIDIAHLEAGLYFVQCYTKSGMFTSKLIKQ